MQDVFTEASGFSPTGGAGYGEKGRNRLNARYAAMFAPNLQAFADARVLDLASHDGRWSYGALRAGAAHVTGIEVRPDLIEKSSGIIKGADREKVRFVAGDVFEEMPRLRAEGARFDIVLCLGLFYHILDHDRLMREMAAFKPGLIIVDTALVDTDEPIIRLKTERTNSILNAAPRAGQGEAPIGVVSRGGLEMLAAGRGYGVTYVDWNVVPVDSRLNLHDYFGTRKEAARGRLARILLGPDVGTGGIRRFSALLRPN